jgi:hypothetical protein
MLDEFNLETIDGSIKERTMSIDVQPPADLRPRYTSDGKRQIEKSRTKPMAFKVYWFVYYFFYYHFCSLVAKSKRHSIEFKSAVLSSNFSGYL